MPEGGFALYVHWPFCMAKCPYCDFNSHVRPGVDAGAFVGALQRELGTIAGRLDRHPKLDSIFFGGGTPSLMPAEGVGAIIEEATKHFSLAEDAEITLEANPTSADATRFAGYRAAGVNRLSMGIQALNDADLKALGRWHSVAEARAAFEMARAIFPRISFDLIYARPGQRVADWEAELAGAIAMAADHLSLYQLTIEEGTKYATLHRQGLLTVPDPDSAAEFYDITQAVTAGAGFDAYEVSNHARPGAQSRHNLVYWRYGEFIGIGPGAHGRIRVDGALHATATGRQPEAWRAAVAQRGDGLTACEPIAPADQATEYLVMALRLDEGLDRARHAALGGRAFDAGRLRTLSEEGLIALDGKRLKATPRGRLVLNSLIAELAR